MGGRAAHECITRWHNVYDSIARPSAGDDGDGERAASAPAGTAAAPFRWEGFLGREQSGCVWVHGWERHSGRPSVLITYHKAISAGKWLPTGACLCHLSCSARRARTRRFRRRRAGRAREADGEEAPADASHGAGRLSQEQLHRVQALLEERGVSLDPADGKAQQALDGQASHGCLVRSSTQELGCLNLRAAVCVGRLPLASRGVRGLVAHRRCKVSAPSTV